MHPCFYWGLNELANNEPTRQFSFFFRPFLRLEAPPPPRETLETFNLSIPGQCPGPWHMMTGWPISHTVTISLTVSWIGHFQGKCTLTRTGWPVPRTLTTSYHARKDNTSESFPGGTLTGFGHDGFPRV